MPFRVQKHVLPWYTHSDPTMATTRRFAREYHRFSLSLMWAPHESSSLWCVVAVFSCRLSRIFSNFFVGFLFAPHFWCVGYFFDFFENVFFQYLVISNLFVGIFVLRCRQSRVLFAYVFFVKCRSLFFLYPRFFFNAPYCQ